MLTPDERKAIREKVHPFIEQDTTSFYSSGRMDAVQVATEQAILSKLEGVTDEEMVLAWAQELFEVWKEAKSELPNGENWSDITWNKLSQKDKDEYLLTARRNVSQLSAVYNARLKQAVEKIKEALNCPHITDRFSKVYYSISLCSECKDKLGEEINE